MFRLINSETGFGFMGMLVLIVSFTIAGTFVVSQLTSETSTNEAKQTTLKVEIIRNAINAYKANHLNAALVPTAGVGAPATLAALLTSNGDACVFDNDNTPGNTGYLSLQGWCGPYIDSMIQEDANAYLRDGWGSQIQYNAATEVLTSYGPNRTDDAGAGDDLVYNP